MVKSNRPLIMGENGAVATNHPQATSVGLDVLRSGGNAVDASIAISLALGVVEPAMSGLGGDGFYHVWLANPGKTIVYNGTGTAPKAAVKGKIFSKDIPVSGPHSVSIPGMVGGLGAMHKDYGTKSWQSLCDPAAYLARSGFFVTHAYRSFAQQASEKIQRNEISQETFLNKSALPDIGTKIKQSKLCQTLTQLGDVGPDGFYRGKLANKIVKDARVAGSLLSTSDFAEYHPEVQDSIAISYRDFEIFQTPPNSTGFVMLQELKIFENFDISEMNFKDPELIHLMVEAKKYAFLDREKYGGDPRLIEVPINHILSNAHTSNLAGKIDLEKAAKIPLLFDSQSAKETTYFSVVDNDGNAVSAIQSINSPFGSGVTGLDTGILFNNRMAYWHLDTAHPNSLTSGKRVRHTMNAPIVTRDGKLWAVFGTPGANNQVQINFQVAVALIDYGLDPQQAVEATRWTSSQPNQGANWPHEGDYSLTIESGLPTKCISKLRRLGHEVEIVPPLEGPCSVSCIRLLSNNTLMAGSDPRRDGWAAAF
ncbi:gamma-glutamyltransferase [Candidatus Puniceispirillum sp.]|nr:gamma-glutamyltransferase [Candidatus Puniceispirillum sp.]